MVTVCFDNRTVQTPSTNFKEHLGFRKTFKRTKFESKQHQNPFLGKPVHLKNESKVQFSPGSKTIHLLLCGILEGSRQRDKEKAVTCVSDHPNISSFPTKKTFLVHRSQNTSNQMQVLREVTTYKGKIQERFFCQFNFLPD